jgi:hypothetical protein
VENLKPRRGSNRSTAWIQAEIALLDEVEERQARRLILLGDGDDQAQVGPDELAVSIGAGDHVLFELFLGGHGEGVAAGQLLRRGQPLLGEGAQPHFIVPGQQGVFPDVIQVELKEVLLLAAPTLRLAQERLQGACVKLAEAPSVVLMDVENFHGPKVSTSWTSPSARST